MILPKEGSKPRLMSLSQALKIAQEAELDLVEVSPDVSPPVCKIMDYGKFKYAQSKKDKLIRRRNVASAQLREVRMTPVISENDLRSKVRMIRKFLTDDTSKVKITIFLKGRMMIRPELAREVLLQVWGEIKDVAQIDSQPNRGGRMISMVVSPLSSATAEFDDSKIESKANA